MWKWRKKKTEVEGENFILKLYREVIKYELLNMNFALIFFNDASARLKWEYWIFFRYAVS